MKKVFFILAVFVMAICANAQTNQYFWYQGNLMMGNPIAQIDSVTFGDGEPADTLHILLPRTIIKEVHDTIYLTVHDTVCPNAIPEGALPGEFSVSATKKVRFSQGNLQYQASTNTWRFAENQWDHVGDDTKGTVYYNNVKCNNALISSTYTGWIDLFGWGTGENPTLSSSNNSDYSIFTDWGIAYSMANSDQTSSMWYTLSSEEWTYIFRGRSNAESLFGLGSVNGVNGLILLPDNWVEPSGINFVASTSLNLVWDVDRYQNNAGNNFTHNTFDANQWQILEESGAVFFPTAAYRYGKNVHINNLDGYYWSTTPDTDNSAFYLGFGGNALRTYNYGGRAGYGRYVGQSVRLVVDVK